MKTKRILVFVSILVTALFISGTVWAGGLPRQGDFPGKVKVLARGGPIHATNGLSFGPDGNLYIASAHGHEIVAMDPDSGNILERIGADQGVFFPDDLTFGPDGALYWTSIVFGQVMKRAPDGTVTSIADLGPGVNPITFSDDGRLFVALDFYGKGLYEVDPNGVNPPRAILPDLVDLNGFDFGPDGLLYGPLFSDGRVVRIDVNTGAMSTVADGFGIPAAAKFDSRGRLHIVDQATGQVVRVDTDTGKKKVIATLSNGLDNLAFNAQDRLFVSSWFDGGIVEVRAHGRARTVSPSGLVSPAGVTTVPDRRGGESVWVADNVVLRQYAGRSGKLLMEHRPAIFGEHATPITVSADGDNLVISSWISGVVQVWDAQTGQVLESYDVPNVALNAIRFQGDLIVAELVSGQVVRLTSSGRTPIAQFQVPTGMAAHGSDLWVADYAQGMVFQVLPDETTVPVASGLAGPEGLAVGQDGNLFVVESRAGRLSQIDLATGEVSTIVEGLEFRQALPGEIPSLFLNGVAAGPSGAIYVTSDKANVLYRVTIHP